MSAGVPPDQRHSLPKHATPSVVIPFNKPPSIEYDGEALRSVTQVSKVAVELSDIIRELPTPELKEQGIAVLEKVAVSMDAIEEHLSVLELHAEMILACMSEEENVYFMNESRRAHMTVTSLMLKRCRTLRIQKFVVGAAQCAQCAQDNDRSTLIAHEGYLACRVTSNS